MPAPQSQPYPESIRMTEVGLRDGLQNEAAFVPTETKLELANALIDAGVRHLEITSFVSPRAVPQLRDAEALVNAIPRDRGVYLAALTPNRRGVQRAIDCKIDSVVFFVSASESHNGKNLNCDITQSLGNIGEAAQLARDAGMPMQGAIAVAFGCPFEGEVDGDTILRIAGHYLELGCQGITLGDTTGMATPPIVRDTILRLRQAFGPVPLTAHLHNTRGMALANMLEALNVGVTSFESSLGGIGGCPFAPGATGNVSTEDAVHMAHHLGIRTGIDLDRLLDAAHRLEAVLGRTLPGQVMKSGDRLRRYSTEAQCAAVG
ncbi:hydroxymethylglutaryl-CoA lyase [Caballeronia sp. LZ032]|uniref:hydroxymethylglutaryl-CoA lyase n=1 Tax=Caballeronia sp. LZ032 TaxID=3038565 RepID=UPI00285F6FFE|nr:hydroxymethylglutaryl-CoA lyase [Caballeronia sp. LZ032]MDR5883442.1 hydroxymethylglutaryl-CoA lyase [Caballeronia sp. LZ032]